MDARNMGCLLGVYALIGWGGNAGRAAGPVVVSLIADRGAGAPANHGMVRLQAALEDRKIAFEVSPSLAKARGQWIVAAGLASNNGAAAEVMRTASLVAPTAAESVLIKNLEWMTKRVVLAGGSDGTGVMYALLEIADRVGWAADAARPFSEVRDTAESPKIAERGVTIFTMQQQQFENRLHDAVLLGRYFDMLAKNRFNVFQVLFAYEMNGYSCPAYPYYVDVPEFPQVGVAGLTKEQQERNLADLNRLIAMAHARGIKVTVGLWCHYYRFDGRWQEADHSKPVDGLVAGLTEQNLIPYTKAAFTRFLHAVHGIDRMMMLMHSESGLKTEDMKVFWDNFYQVMKTEAPKMPFEIRAKGVSDDLIQYAQDLGLNMRVNTKYWSEQVGLPFHPTHVQELNQFDRRHGYSDMLKNPRNYELHWTLWTSGTTRVLLWGDPEYVRRFAGTVGLGGVHGFDIMEPLATKMAGQPHSEQPFELLTPRYRYYDYEFERYWHFFQVFGRLTYNPDTPRETWDREFGKRFGPAREAVEEALHRASGILPYIVAYCLPASRFPTTRGWPERQRQEDLADYAKVEPSDVEQFESFQEAARTLITGSSSAKISPMAMSRWFGQASQDVFRLAAEAERKAGPNQGKELVSTLVDLRILANLALYHSRRIPAGLSMALYQQTHDLNALDDAVAQEREAVEAWDGIVRAAGDVYSSELKMGLAEFDLSGHWRDELVKLKAGLALLERQRRDFRVETARVVGSYDLDVLKTIPGNPQFTRGKLADSKNVLALAVPSGRYQVTVGIRDPGRSHGPMWIELNGAEASDVFSVPAGQPVERTLETSAVDRRIKLLFDNVTSADWHANTVTVKRVDPVIAHVPVRRVKIGQEIVLRATVNGIDPIAKVEVLFAVGDGGYITMPMSKAEGGRYTGVIPRAPIGLGSCPKINYFLEATDSKGRTATWPQDGRAHPVPVLTTDDAQAPTVQHTPATHAPAGQPLHLVARVQDPSGVKQVLLRYRGLSQHQDFRTIPMLPTGRDDEFDAVIPALDIDPKFDLMYLLEVTDNAGNGAIYPDLHSETPYVIVQIQPADRY